MSDDPAIFFRDFVRRAYDEHLQSPLDEYRAKSAVQEIDNMAERMWHYWSKRDPSKVYNTASASGYREYLRANVCQDFGLVWDVHDAHKHVELTRRIEHRKVTTHKQTGADKAGWSDASWAEQPWSGGDMLTIRLDGGEKRSLGVVLKNAIEMWEQLLH